LLLNVFFPIVDMCLICEDIARQSCAMVPRWRFLATCSRFQTCILKSHQGHTMCGSMADIQSPTADIRRGKKEELEMWTNAQRDGRPVEYRWRPLSNAAVCLTPTSRVPCSNAAKTRNPLKLAGVPQTNETISAVSGPKFTILWGHVEELLLLNNFFPIVDTSLSCEDIARQNCALVPRWRFLATFLRPAFAASREQHISDLHSKFALGPRHV